MDTKAILASIDAEISRLQQVRILLTNNSASQPSSALPAKKGPGRPKKVVVPTPTKKAKKRVLSAEARARIAAAQKKRWAATKAK